MGIGGGLRAGARGLRESLFSEGAIFILLAALVACLPLLIRGGTSCGHDFEFHLVNWMETKRAWSEGLFYPHWAQSPNWSAGEPRFVFYPPISWMAGALIGLVMGWKWTAAVFTYLCLVASGFSTRALARAFLPGPIATLAGVIATATPYALFVAYERTAFSELAAAALIPLLLLFALRAEGAGEKRASFPALPVEICWLAAILAAVWLTNAPTGVMASYLLAFAATVAALLQRSWRPALRASLAAPLALGLAAVYLVPAAWEQRWIAINQALDVGMRVKDSWLFARHASPDMQLHDQVLLAASVILLSTALSAALSLGFAWRMRKLEKATRSYWIPVALLIPIVFALQFPIARPVWMLPKMQFLQFPWRWLVVLDVPFAIFLAAATSLRGRRVRWAASLGWTVVIAALVSVASRSFFQVCDDEDNVANQIAIFRNDEGVEGTDEYAPRGADNTLVASTLPDACLVSDPTRELGVSEKGSEPTWYAEQGSCDQTFNARLWQTEHKVLDLDSDHAGFLILRVRRYPAWRVSENGRPEPEAASRDDGLMVIPVAAGRDKIDLRWMTTPDELWGRWLSLASGVIFGVLAWFGRARQSRVVHLSS